MNQQIRTAPRRLLILTIPSALVGALTYWVMVAWSGYAGHAALFPRVNAWIALGAAYVTGAAIAQGLFVWGRYKAIGRAENVSPTLLFLVTPEKLSSGIEALLFPVTLVALAPYVAWLIGLTVLRICGAGSQRALPRPAEVASLAPDGAVAIEPGLPVRLPRGTVLERLPR